MTPASAAEDIEGTEVASSPFRAAFGRARDEARETMPTGREPFAVVAEPHRRRFEYRLLKRKRKRMRRTAEQEHWNTLGRKGWELVGLTDDYAAFKRPL